MIVVMYVPVSRKSQMLVAPVWSLKENLCKDCLGKMPKE